MVTSFNKGDMISFGRYLVSKERREAFEATQENSPTSLEDRLSDVHAADFANWMELRNAEPKPDRKVKVGDMVLYIPSPEQEYDKYTKNNNAEVVPALVTAVWSEECVNLTVFPDAPYGSFGENGFCPVAVSITSCTKLPEGTHNPQTGMWKFK